MVSKKETGDFGEDLAKDYLIEQGYRFLDRNVANRYGEIDLIVQKKSHIHFVEIRTRLGKGYGTALESLTEAKLGRVRMAAQALWLENNKWRHHIPFLSVLTIDEQDDGHLKIEFLPDAFE